MKIVKRAKSVSEYIDCKDCNKTLIYTDFHMSRGYLNHGKTCKVCYRKIEREKEKDPIKYEKIKENQRQWYKDNRERVCKKEKEKASDITENGLYRGREKFIWRMYKVTGKDYVEMLNKQNNCCAICKKHIQINNIHGRESQLDHCHETGKFRGVLCTQCNTGIGMLRDSIQNLKNAIEYLTPYKQNQ